MRAEKVGGAGRDGTEQRVYNFSTGRDGKNSTGQIVTTGRDGSLQDGKVNYNGFVFHDETGR